MIAANQGVEGDTIGQHWHTTHSSPSRACLNGVTSFSNTITLPHLSLPATHLIKGKPRHDRWFVGGRSLSPKLEKPRSHSEKPHITRPAIPWLYYGTDKNKLDVLPLNIKLWCFYDTMKWNSFKYSNPIIPLTDFHWLLPLYCYEQYNY